MPKFFLRQSQSKTTYHIARHRNLENSGAMEAPTMKIKLLAWSTCLLGLSGVLNAQITTATLAGTVTDKTGAVVIDAKVTATNTGTTLQRSVKTNPQGQPRMNFPPAA